MSCIVWDRTKAVTGYGVVKDKRYPGKLIYAHRLSYCDHHGIDLEDIAGLHIRHTCDNRPCVNPDHLLLGNNQDNIDDKVSRNRQMKGEQIIQSKLTEDQVRAILDEYVPRSRTHGQYALSRKYNVSRPLISNIVNRKGWKHIT